MLQDLGGEVVVVQVRARDRSQHPDELGREVIRTGVRGGVFEDVRHPVLPVHDDGPFPGEVVQPHVVEGDPVGFDGEAFRQPPLERDRDVAEPDRPVAFVKERLGHESGGVGEVDEPRAGCAAAGGLLRELEHDRHGAEGLRESARPRGLLADEAEPAGDRLVGQARGLAADPELHDHEVCALQGLVAAVGEDEPAGPPHAAEHPVGQGPDDLEAFGIGIQQDELVDGRRSARVTKPSTSSGVYVLPPPATDTFTPTARHRTLRP